MIFTYSYVPFSLISFWKFWEWYFYFLFCDIVFEIFLGSNLLGTATLYKFYVFSMVPLFTVPHILYLVHSNYIYLLIYISYVQSCMLSGEEIYLTFFFLFFFFLNKSLISIRLETIKNVNLYWFILHLFVIL